MWYSFYYNTGSGGVTTTVINYHTRNPSFGKAKKIELLKGSVQPIPVLKGIVGKKLKLGGNVSEIKTTSGKIKSKTTIKGITK